MCSRLSCSTASISSSSSAESCARGVGKVSYSLRDVRTHVLTYLLTYYDPFFLSYLLAYLLRPFLTYLLTCLLTYLLTYLLTTYLRERRVQQGVGRVAHLGCGLRLGLANPNPNPTLTLTRNAQAASRTTSGSAEGKYRGDVGEIQGRCIAHHVARLGRRGAVQRGRATRDATDLDQLDICRRRRRDEAALRAVGAVGAG